MTRPRTNSPAEAGRRIFIFSDPASKRQAGCPAIAAVKQTACPPVPVSPWLRRRFSPPRRLLSQRHGAGCAPRWRLHGCARRNAIFLYFLLVRCGKRAPESCFVFDKGDLPASRFLRQKRDASHRFPDSSLGKMKLFIRVGATTGRRCPRITRAWIQRR